jgi:kynurenine formamidase
MSQEAGPNIGTVVELAKRYTNWGRWGEDDQLGTLNHIRPEHIIAAARLATAGKVISMCLPLDDAGPQIGAFGRFNPIHLMFRDGNSAVTGTVVRDFYGGRDRHIRGTDDLLILPLQSGTQWDSLAHIIHEKKIYNGYDATWVGSKGALKNDITNPKDRVVGRGVFLDLPLAKGRPWLDPGEVITPDDLDACAGAHGVEVGTGDIVLIRTGQMAQCRDRGSWGDYAGGPAPGLGLECVGWIHERQIAALATDTWGAEVLPNQTPDVFQPFHIVSLVYMGLLLGEIFDLEALAADCRADGRYEFLFSGVPLPITGGVGSPVNPLAIK